MEGGEAKPHTGDGRLGAAQGRAVPAEGMKVAETHGTFWSDAT